MPPTRSTKQNAPKSKASPSAFIALQYGKRPPHIVAREKVSYHDLAILTAQKEFPQLARATGIEFLTDEFALCDGEAMVISPDVWAGVISSVEVTKLVVVTNKDQLKAENASAEDAANDFDDFDILCIAVPQKRPVEGPMSEEIVWNVKTHSDGTLTETNTGLDVSYLYWEARTNPHSTQLSPPPSPAIGQGKEDFFSPASSSFTDTNAVLLAVSTITPYLDSALQTLGLDTEARTSFITYSLPSLLKHKHVVLRFVSQAAYEQSAPLDITPKPDVVTRVFMLFRRVEEEELDLWPAASARASEPVDFWRDVIDVEKRERQNDASLFRVLEWGGMEVL